MADKKEKRYYDVRIECLVPSEITYRVLAEDEEDALKQAISAKIPTKEVKPRLHQKRVVKASVFDAGTCMLRLARRYFQ